MKQVRNPLQAGSRSVKMLLVACLVLLGLYACQNLSGLGVYEKMQPVPHYNWDYAFRPEFDIRIQDTGSQYNMYVMLRHNNGYAYSNLWVLITMVKPDGSKQTQRVELPLADTEGRWMGSGIDDIFEHKIPIQQHARFNEPGEYRFILEQNMRVNPLPDIMAVGFRIEKVTR